MEKQTVSNPTTPVRGPANKKWRPEWDGILRDAREAGVGWTTVARKLGVTQSTVQRNADRLGLRDYLKSGKSA